jgi:hypothetical protein
MPARRWGTMSALSAVHCSDAATYLDDLFDGRTLHGDDSAGQGFFEHLADCHDCRHSFYARFQVRASTHSRLL